MPWLWELILPCLAHVSNASVSPEGSGHSGPEPDCFGASWCSSSPSSATNQLLVTNPLYVSFHICEMGISLRSAAGQVRENDIKPSAPSQHGAAVPWGLWLSLSEALCLKLGIRSAPKFATPDCPCLIPICCWDRFRVPQTPVSIHLALVPSF